jgi:hypothetical protein
MEVIPMVEFQGTSNRTATMSSTSTQILNSLTKAPGALKRVAFIITNTSAAAVVTIALQDSAATAGQGVRLQPNGVFSQSTDGGMVCWQGAVQAVSDVAGSVAVMEQFATGD